ncbi:hypothetical protein CI665_026665 [Klebsiella quasipneumoniae subsp. similipneumoniae]|nr:hypothetical protein CR231_26250 [Klebsiella pneumoniae]QDJ80132.1 hypothetical protein CI667_0026990 [Klebsiella pneumoniae subsp. pneumoniae]TNJ70383.1 hypothetical protein CI665_026665 [Klebsiella quasipneumoniae subsp. similipneumoniae]MBX4541702.1 hypothetical protein [Klebsiella pneumoniae]MCQ4061057.1 hypothetical protein [Klebsiella pneumoniae]
MRMFALCRCVAYGYAAHILFSHFFTADPKKAIVGNAVPEPSGWPDDIVDPRTGQAQEMRDFDEARRMPYVVSGSPDCCRVVICFQLPPLRGRFSG